MLRELLRSIALTGLLFLGACGESPTPITGCEASAGIQPDCRFQNPEDLAVLPSNHGLHMMPQDAQTSAMLKSALLGADSGFVYAWNQESGFTTVAGSEGPFPNGIEKSADESHLFIIMYMAGDGTAV